MINILAFLFSHLGLEVKTHECFLGDVDDKNCLTVLLYLFKNI